MKRQILFALFIAFILSGYAQDRIVKGYVFDEYSKEGLDSALVTVFDTNIFVYTYKSGAFNINLPKRRRHLYISKEGYEGKKIILGPGFH